MTVEMEKAASLGRLGCSSNNGRKAGEPRAELKGGC